MKYKIEVEATTPNEENLALLIHRIADMIDEGYTSGFDMTYTWALLEIEEGEEKLSRCRICGAWINPGFGADSPAEHNDAEGTREDPRAPGDYDDICASCGYGD